MSENKEIKDLIKFPVETNKAGHVFDSTGAMICASMRDGVGDFIAESLNSRVESSAGESWEGEGVENQSPDSPKYESFYDKQIAPLLMEIIKRCEQYELPFVAACQYGEDASHFAVVSNQLSSLESGKNDCSLELDILNNLARNRCNLDNLAIQLNRRFKSESLGSMFLEGFNQLTAAQSEISRLKSEREAMREENTRYYNLLDKTFEQVIAPLGAYVYIKPSPEIESLANEIFQTLKEKLR